ncbi:MAG TPA: DUF1254 domain-containing protein [Panacibacter sp.]|nr:DUF1254 domain-containing protein [Panacibacter sp.]HNP43999.1 DUF1254 domain-containing protein [Panacibacter sp.]
MKQTGKSTQPLLLLQCSVVGYLVIAFAFVMLSCNGSSSKTGSANSLSQDSIESLARQAYLFGYPLVLMNETMRTTTNVEAPVWNNVFAPANQFGHFRAFPDATFKAVVKPNCDTYYSSAWLDLSGEPMVLTVPDTKGRYYLLPMLDAYTNVFASPGKRTTGTAAGKFLITGPAFTGKVPDRMVQIKAPTDMVWILGRTQVNNARDGKDIVYKIQDNYTLTPLSKWGIDYKPAKNLVDSSISTNPPLFVEHMDIETFFNSLNELMVKDPPAKYDSVLLNKLSAIGIGAGKKFSLSNFDSSTQKALKGLPAAVHQQLRDMSTKVGSLENNWNVTRSGMGSYGTNYGMRAFVALIGLGANLNADACYPICKLDENGASLDGAKKYLLHFDKGQTPPATAFWSLTMYGPDDLLVANPINRFTIGDRSSLQYNADSSVDIYIQNEPPSKDKESNWLPAPKGSFTLTMRLYWPKESFLNGSWKIPAVKVVQ